MVRLEGYFRLTKFYIPKILFILQTYQIALLFQSLKMGNYCCSEENQDLPNVPVLKKKVSLKDPSIRKNYEQQLTSILNVALIKYSQEKSIISLCLRGELGKGGQGSVFQVEVTEMNKEDIMNKQNFAMKRVSKQKLDIQRTKQALMLEKQILMSHQSSFLTKIQYAFQDSSYLYYLMDMAEGGDLFSLFRTLNNLNPQKTILYEQKREQTISFILAGIILGLQYLHDKDIIYRDLKPQNILIFKDGYPKLADFGIAVKNKPNELTYDVKGTILYFSPEMVMKKGYNKSTDLWALGILIYELFFHEPPFTSTQINSKQFEQKCKKWEMDPKFPKPLNECGQDLVTKLLRVQPEQRIGYYDFGQIKSHSFFKGIDWCGYGEKQLRSPIEQLIQEYPIQLNPQINETLQIEEREYVPFTFVKSTKENNSFMSEEKWQRTGTHEQI